MPVLLLLSRAARAAWDDRGRLVGARSYHALSDRNFSDVVLGLLSFLSGLVWSGAASASTSAVIAQQSLETPRPSASPAASCRPRPPRPAHTSSLHENRTDAS